MTDFIQVRPENVDILYQEFYNPYGTILAQPASDLVLAGTLDDPDTGKELDVVGIQYINPETNNYVKLYDADLSRVSLVYEGDTSFDPEYEPDADEDFEPKPPELYYQPITDIVESDTLIDPVTGEDMDLVAVFIVDKKD